MSTQRENYLIQPDSFSEDMADPKSSDSVVGKSVTSCKYTCSSVSIKLQIKRLKLGVEKGEDKKRRKNRIRLKLTESEKQQKEAEY